MASCHPGNLREWQLTLRRINSLWKFILTACSLFFGVRTGNYF